RRLRAYRGRDQPAGAPEISILDRPQAHDRQSGALACEGKGASRLLVARLARGDQETEQRGGGGARARRRAACPDRGWAGKLCKGQGLRQATSLRRRGAPCGRPLLKKRGVAMTLRRFTRSLHRRWPAAKAETECRAASPPAG